MKSRCPHCGNIADVPQDNYRRYWLCESCGHEYLVGVVHIKDSAFVNGRVNVLCPFCGETNILPVVASNRDVRCANCDGKFHVHVTKSIAMPRTGTNSALHKGGNAQTGLGCRVPKKIHIEISAKLMWVIVSAIASIILFIWSLPWCLNVIRDLTGTDLGLGKIIYSDYDCGLEIAAALSENNYEQAMEWANRIRDERIRRMQISNINHARKIHNDLNKLKMDLNTMQW